MECSSASLHGCCMHRCWRAQVAPLLQHCRAMHVRCVSLPGLTLPTLPVRAQLICSAHAGTAGPARWPPPCTAGFGMEVCCCPAEHADSNLARAARRVCVGRRRRTASPVPFASDRAGPTTCSNATIEAVGSPRAGVHTRCARSQCAHPRHVNESPLCSTQRLDRGAACATKQKAGKMSASADC